MKEKKVAKNLPEDLLALIGKASDINKHLLKNKQDQPARRGLTLTRSKIKRLADYYKKSNKLPKDWKSNLPSYTSDDPPNIARFGHLIFMRHLLSSGRFRF